MIITFREVVENEEFLPVTIEDLVQTQLNFSNCLRIRAFVKSYNCVEFL